MNNDGKDKEITQLREALKWFLTEGVQYSKESNKFNDAGCGCCSSQINPPISIFETIMKVLQE